MESHKQTIKLVCVPEEINYSGPINDLYLINSPILCDIGLYTNERLAYHIKKGFSTNFRSGPKFLDRYIDRIGPAPLAISWIVHDINYEGYLSQKKADTLLYLMLRNAGIGKKKCETVYVGLRLFGFRNYVETKNNPYIEFVQAFQAPEHWLGKTTDIQFLEGLNLQNYMGKASWSGETSALDEELIFDKENYDDIKSEMIDIARANHMDLDPSELERHFQ